MVNYTTTLVPLLNNLTNLTNFTYNGPPENSQNQPNDSATIATPYIALIISMIGLASTIIVHYNIRRKKICCRRKNSREHITQPTRKKEVDGVTIDGVTIDEVIIDVEFDVDNFLTETHF